MKIDYYTPFYTNQFYHVYNRGNNGEKIFYSTRNYYHFLNLYDKYLSDCVNTYAYCLIPNHFHFLIRVRDSSVISDQFRIFFLSYSKAINKQESRTGSLFQKRFKRTTIEELSHCNGLFFIFIQTRYTIKWEKALPIINTVLIKVLFLISQQNLNEKSYLNCLTVEKILLAFITRRISV